MELKKLNKDFSVCKVEDYSLVNLDAEYSFTGQLSLFFSAKGELK